jgi:hypothetical protein
VPGTLRQNAQETQLRISSLGLMSAWKINNRLIFTYFKYKENQKPGWITDEKSDTAWFVFGK